MERASLENVLSIFYPQSSLLEYTDEIKVVDGKCRVFVTTRQAVLSFPLTFYFFVDDCANDKVIYNI